jgi:hypothetical protein
MIEITEITQQAELAPEALWAKLETHLSGENIAEDHIGVVPIISELFELLTPSRRDFIAQKMTAVLADIRPGQRFSTLTFNVLSLISPYITRSDHAHSARRMLKTLFNSRYWPSYTDEELDAVAIAASLLAADLTLSSWIEFLQRRRDKAIGIALMPAARIDLSALIRIRNEIGLTDNFEKAVIAAYPALRRRYSDRDLSSSLRQLLKTAGDDEGYRLRTLLNSIQAVTPSVVLPFEEMFRPLLAQSNGNFQTAALLGGALVTSYGHFPGSAEFRAGLRWAAEEACIKYPPDPNTKNSKDAGRFVGEFLRGAASAAHEQLSSTLSHEWHGRDLRRALIDRVGRFRVLGDVAQDLCSAARACDYYVMSIDCTEYHEDQAYKAMLQLLIQHPTIRLNFYSKSWAVDAEQPPAPQDIRIAVKLGSGDEPQSPVDNRHLYDFAGSYVFVCPEWLRLDETRRKLPEKIDIYVRALLECDFNVEMADVRCPEYGLAARAWLALFGGALKHGGQTLRHALFQIEKGAEPIGDLPSDNEDYGFARDSDEVFEGIITGSMPAVVVGAIHGDLLSTWWSRGLLPSPLWRLPLLRPSDFSEIMRGQRFANYLQSGFDSGDKIAGNLTEPQTQYLNAWVNMLRSIGAIFAEIAQSQARGNLPKDAIDLISDLLFLELSFHKERLPMTLRPGMKWAFVADKEAISRILRFDTFRMQSLRTTLTHRF